MDSCSQPAKRFCLCPSRTAFYVAGILISMIGQGVSAQVCLQPPNFYCAGSPQFPLSVPKMLINNTQHMGTWYEFMKYNPPYAYDNLVMYWAPVGNTLSGLWSGVDPNPNKQIKGIFINLTVTLNDPTTLACKGNFEFAYFSNEGRTYALSVLDADPVDQGKPLFVYYDILFTDYTTLSIFSTCQSINFDTQMCDKIVLSVAARKKPGQLTAAEKTYIQTTVDATLKPYCMSSSQLSFTFWNGTIPVCNPPAPASFVSLITSFASYTT